MTHQLHLLCPFLFAQCAQVVTVTSTCYRLARFEHTRIALVQRVPPTDREGLVTFGMLRDPMGPIGAIGFLPLNDLVQMLLAIRNILQELNYGQLACFYNVHLYGFFL